MAGLFTGFNLSESGLNAAESLQKLYAPSIQNDINYFAFASRLQSSIGNDQIYGLENQPLSNAAGDTFLRTKILTNNFTFSDNNVVWFDTLDTSIDPTNAVKLQRNGALVNLKIQSKGSKYKVKNGAGVEVGSYPAEVDVRVFGRESRSDNAVVRVEVNSNGQISGIVQVVTPGTGYISSEYLDLLPQCLDSDTPSEDKCLNYAGTALHQDFFDPSEVAYQAILQNDKYRYKVRFSDSKGFFLYDEFEQEWLYLGSSYDTVQNISAQVTISRDDSIKSDNLLNLYRLDAESRILSYYENDGYSVSSTLGATLRSISNQVEEYRARFSDFLQNVRIQKTSNSLGNKLGVTYNTFSGYNVVSDYRVIFRDPDGVLDTSDFDFFELRDLLTQPGQVTLDDIAIPGIFLNTGEKYQRVFSSDDKPFVSQSGRDYLSPRLFKLSAGTVVPASATADFKYSISTGYLKPGTTTILGFDTEITTLIQNISTTSSNSGFVFHRTLTTTTSGGVTSWPMFSYRNSLGVILDAKILAIS